jgi:hypothetical protein
MNDELFKSTPAEPTSHAPGSMPVEAAALAFRQPPVESMERAPIAAISMGAMDSLMHAAVSKGVEGVEVLERLVALNERMMDRAAAQEFAGALARFQAAVPPIAKTREAKEGVTRSGGKFGGYLYAPLDEVARTVNPLLSAEGLSYSWDTWFSDDGKKLRVTCTLRHANGHSISSQFEAPTETVTQAMSAQQKVANAQSYGRRYSLIAILGLTTTDPDDDAATERGECITPDQVLVLESLIDKRPDGTRKKLLDWTAAEWGAATLEDIPASRFGWLCADLEAKISRDAR